jgi:hypothetical protein
MRRRVAVALLGVSALVLAALVWPGLPGGATGNQRRALSSVAPEAGAAQRAATPARPTRDLFRFGDSQSAETRPAQTPSSSPAATVTAAPPARVRLIGFVRTQGRLKAVVAVEGTINVLGSGEETGGFRILDLDEDAGNARLRTPEGEELEVALAPR